jgi:hypothetical protein
MDSLKLLDEEEADLLPRRETMLTIVMPVIDVNLAIAANNAFAINAATIASFASATAGQVINFH